MADQFAGSTFNCPDLELIAAYLDGRVSERDRASIADHLSTCEDCYAVFVESARHRLQDRKAHVLLWRRAAIATATLAAAAALVLFVQSGVIQRMRPGTGANLAELVAAVGAQRTIEPRLTGGFAYAPLRAPTRSGEPAAGYQSPDVKIAAAKIEKLATQHRSAEALGSLGIAHLVMGDLDKAVAVLEEAADRPNPTAQVLSDLSAAYLARGTAHERVQDVARALAQAERAIKADPRVNEARFNRALALERLSLSDQAREAWEDYLKADTQSGWATEARRHLDALKARPRSQVIDDERRQLEVAVLGGDRAAIYATAEQHPRTAREWLEDQLLVTWPTLVLEGRTTEARDLLTRLGPAGEALSQQRDDAFLRDSIAAALEASAHAARARTLAEAHRRYRSAYVAYMDDRIADSATLFLEARRRLEQAESPFALPARRYLAVARYSAGDLDTASTELNRLAAVAHERRYTRLLGIIHQLRGLIYGVRGELAEALDQYERALNCYRTVGDLDNEAGISAIIAEALDLAGDRDQAWSKLQFALSKVDLVREFARRHTILQQASLIAHRSELPEVALQFQQATLDNAVRAKRSPGIVNGFVFRAAIHKQLGNIQLAAADLDRARRALAGISDPNLVARNTALIDLALGELHAEHHPVEAVEALERALSFFQRTRVNWPVAEAYLARGRAQLAVGREDQAEADFLTGIEVFEQMRASLTTEALRSSYFEQPWDLFTEMIRFQAVRRNRQDRALAFAERGRARTLLEAVSPRAAVPLVDPSAARADLPAGVTVVYYASLNDRLLVWMLTRTGVHFVDAPTRQSDLARLIGRYRSSIGAVAANARDTESLMGMYDALIRPIRGRLADGTRIVVIPDGVLHGVPFAALVSREDRRYLVEDHSIQIAPSMTIFLSSRSRKSLQWTHAGAVVVGNPGIDPAGVSKVADLPEAEAEARDIAAMYETVEVLVGRQVTKQRFLAAAAAHDIVHFAGHAISNDEFPALSRLLLSGPGETTRSLFAHEIAAQRFTRTQLVVLAACRTSAGRIRRGEGVFSLARPFIAAGVPIVVASLWDVDDRASRRFFVTFHRALRQGQAATDALRSAQLRAIGEHDPVLRDPANWGTFSVVGGASALGTVAAALTPVQGEPRQSR